MTAAAITEPTAINASFERAEIDMDVHLLSAARRYPSDRAPLPARPTTAERRRSRHASHLPPLVD